MTARTYNFDAYKDENETKLKKKWLQMVQKIKNDKKLAKNDTKLNKCDKKLHKVDQIFGKNDLKLTQKGSKLQKLTKLTIITQK